MTCGETLHVLLQPLVSCAEHAGDGAPVRSFAQASRVRAQAVELYAEAQSMEKDFGSPDSEALRLMLNAFD